MKDPDRDLSSPWALTEFQNLLLGRSPIPVLLARLPFPALKYWQFDAHRRRIKSIFHMLPLLEETKPKFIFAHIVAPHPPFVFGSHGEPISPVRNFSFNDGSHYVKGRNPADYIHGYALQAEYISKKVLETSQKILDKSPDAIILIQGDHGPGAHLKWNSYVDSDMRERLAILNAYHVPDTLRAKLYPSITPVNTFRLILSDLFGARLDRLPDRSYFSRWHQPYLFQDVTDELTPIE